MIENKVTQKECRIVKIFSRGLALSHLFFVDDVLLFSEANTAQAIVVASTVAKFHSALGMMITRKLTAFVAAGVFRHTRESIKQKMGISLTSNLGRYIGIPIYIRRAKRDKFKFLIDKIKIRLAGWKAIFLNLAGKTTLVQSMLTIIPIYAIQSC